MSKIEITRVGNGIVSFLVDDVKQLSVSNLQDLQIEIVGNGNNAVLIHSPKFRQVIKLTDELIINGEVGPTTIEGIFNVLALEVFNVVTSDGNGGSGTDVNVTQALASIAQGMNDIAITLGGKLKTFNLNNPQAPLDPATGTNQASLLGALSTTTFKTTQQPVNNIGYNTTTAKIWNQGTASTITWSAVAIPCNVKSIKVDNDSGVDIFLKLVNGTGVPIVGTTSAGMGVHRIKTKTTEPIDLEGTLFSSGLAYMITGGLLNTDTTTIPIGIYTVTYTLKS